MRTGRLAALAVLAGILALSPAARADSVNIQRFSRTVSGNTGGANNTVTVTLLRNTGDPATGLPVRHPVDSFTTTADGAGNWSGSFASHAMSTAQDEIEVAASAGTSPPTLLTVGADRFAPEATAAGGRTVRFGPANLIDNATGVRSDGKALSTHHGGSCTCGPPATFSVQVNGGAPVTQASGNFSFATPLTNGDTVLVTDAFTGSGATVRFTDNAPLLTVPLSGDSGPVTRSKFEPRCVLFVVTSEVVCGVLDPGSYTLTQSRGGSPIASQPLSVPARMVRYTTEQLSLAASTPLGVRPGDQFTLAAGAHRLTTLTAGTLIVQVLSPQGDPLNGASDSVTGSCTPGASLLDNAGTTCGADGSIPTGVRFSSIHNPLSSSDANLVTQAAGPGELDDSGAGRTEVDQRYIRILAPEGGNAIALPSNAAALVRFNDPQQVVATVNSRPLVGPSPVPRSQSAADPVSFGVAPLGSTAYSPVGNINVPGGIPLPGLAPGAYQYRATETDPHGDTVSQESSFSVEPTPPAGPAAAACQARADHGLRATASRASAHPSAKHRSTHKRKKAKRRKKTTAVTVILTCLASPGSRVTAWIQRGATVVGDGSATAPRGSARIVIRGAFRRGTYTLVTLVTAANGSADGVQRLRLR